MAIANVICRGFGPGASVAFVVTRGYTIGTIVLVTVRPFTPEPRSYAATFNTVREFTPEPRSYACTVTTGREPMVTVAPIAPGETRTFTWTFTLASGETISTATPAAVQNCTLSGSATTSGATVSQQVAIASGATLETYAQVRCRITTSAGRQLDRTMQSLIAKHVFNVGMIDPNDTDDLTVNAVNLIGSATISSVVCAMETGDATLGTPTNTTTTATVRVSSADDSIQRVQYTLTLSNSEVVRQIGRMRVGEL